MPLGKLSRNQIEKAYKILTELQDLIKSGGSANRLLDSSNKFYTLIPHDFGLQKPPVLKTEDQIKLKIEMVDSLLQIEVAYGLLQDSEEGKSPIDTHYLKLNTDIEVLNKKSEEYSLLQEYLKNTHAATHGNYALKIRKAFKVNRHGEAKRYKPFKKLHNRCLLWHGSRITNFAGILTNGLKIAPPEAPVTGYMFGKGIYFADMVSKSANYCFATRDNPVGLLLLCEVALGDMYERTGAEMITKLPSGKHSTKGIGASHPDPSLNRTTKDGVIVPLGKPTTERIHSSLLYNEYIVYDVAQVNIKYLMQVDFKWT